MFIFVFINFVCINLYFNYSNLTGTSNGDIVRNRSPFVRFTITDPETRQITAAGQIPLNSTPPGPHTSSVTNTSESLGFF